MCLGSSPDAPAPPAKAPEAAQTPVAPTRTTAERDAQRRRRAAGGGGRSTILTSPQGVQDGTGVTTQATLLGQ